MHVHTYTAHSESVNCIYIHKCIYSGIAPIINGVATVTINGLVCEEEYMITAGGTLNGQLVGPRSSRGTITGYCPPVVTPTIVPTESTDSKEEIHVYTYV